MPQLEVKSNDEEFHKIIIEMEQAGVERDEWGNRGSCLLGIVSQSWGVWAEWRGEADDCLNDQKSNVSHVKESVYKEYVDP